MHPNLKVDFMWGEIPPQCQIIKTNRKHKQKADAYWNNIKAKK